MLLHRDALEVKVLRAEVVALRGAYHKHGSTAAQGTPIHHKYVECQHTHTPGGMPRVAPGTALLLSVTWMTTLVLLTRPGTAAIRYSVGAAHASSRSSRITHTSVMDLIAVADPA